MDAKAPKRAPKFWHGMLIGTLAGLLVAGLVYLVVQPEKGLKILKKIEFLPSQAESIDSSALSTESAIQKKVVFDTIRLQTVDSLSQDVLLFQDVEDTLYNVDFALDEEDGESEHVLRNACLAMRRIPVESAHDFSIATPDFAEFEVEQWSDYAKNRMLYQRTGNVLKIKGIDIQNVRVFYALDGYKLLYKGHEYAIPENSSFEKLIAGS